MERKKHIYAIVTDNDCGGKQFKYIPGWLRKINDNILNQTSLTT